MEVKTVVRCYFKTFGDFVSIYSSDVSKDGILVKSDTPLQVGDAVRLEFKLRNDYPLIMGEGEVARVGANGASIKFLQLDADSEKFLNEVVKVKAAELKPVAGAPAVTYDAEVVQEEAVQESFELDDAFAGIQEVVTEEAEEIDTGAFEDVDTGGFEDVDTASMEPADSDPFAEFASATEETAEPVPANAEADFSGLSLAPQDDGDPFGEIATDDPAAEDDAGTDLFAGQPAAVEPAQDYAQDEESTGYEDVEASPSNPQALFDDIQDHEDGGAAVSASHVPSDEATTGGSTTIFERISVLKERRALFIGAGVGLVVLLAAGGAWLFLGSQSDEAAPVAVAALEPAPVVPQAPQDTVVAPVTAATVAVAPGASTAASTQAAPAAVAPVAPAPVPAAPVAAKVAPAAAPAPVKAEPVAAPAPVAVAAKPAKAVVKSGPATKIVDIEVLGDGSVAIRGDGAFQKVKHFTMSEPNRIIVDLYGVAKAFKGLNRSGTGAIARVRPGEHEGKIRFVLDLKKETGKIPAYELSSDGEAVIVRPGR